MKSSYDSYDSGGSRTTEAGSSTWTQRRARRKTDWAGVPIGCAFNMALDYYLRLEAQRRFYRMCRNIQNTAMKAAGGGDSDPTVKPQIAPCYTTYPASLAAQAAIGLTGFLEFRGRAPGQALLRRLGPILKTPPIQNPSSVDPAVYAQVAQRLAKSVQTRLLLHALSRTPEMAAVEIYRLFSACQQNLRFRTLSEIVDAVVLYGDVLPDWEVMELHVVTQQLFERIESTSRHYLSVLDELESNQLLDLGQAWVRELLTILLPHLPGEQQEEMQAAPPPGSEQREGLAKLGKPEPLAEPPERFGPLDAPTPPSAVEAQTPVEALARGRQRTPPPRPTSPIPSEVLPADLRARLERERLIEGKKRPPPAPDPEGEILRDFSRVLQEASGQAKVSDDIRSDLLEETLRRGAFEAGPLQGNPVDGHEVMIRLGDNRVVESEVYDRPVELCQNDAVYHGLLADSEPIIRELKRVLYPNKERVPETARLCTGGAIDGGRLPLAQFSGAIFKRSNILERPDPRGRPVLLLVCDGSGSLNNQQMRMTKLLASSWLASTARTNIKVLAALYNMESVSRGISGPLIRWIYHPEKTPAVSQSEAIRAVAALGVKGSGSQADAPSLQFLLDEALRVSRGRSLYLVLISDTQWIRSLGGESGYAEVRAVLEDHMRRLKERLHVTLVALGVNGETGFENVVDAVVRISNEEVSDAGAVAKKLALYVASCMRERRKLITEPR